MYVFIYDFCSWLGVVGCFGPFWECFFYYGIFDYFVTNEFIISRAHTDGKGFIKTTSATSQCVSGIKYGRLIWSGPCKPDTIKNKNTWIRNRETLLNAPKSIMPNPEQASYMDWQHTPCDCKIGHRHPNYVFVILVKHFGLVFPEVQYRGPVFMRSTSGPGLVNRESRSKTN